MVCWTKNNPSTQIWLLKFEKIKYYRKHHVAYHFQKNLKAGTNINIKKPKKTLSESQNFELQLLFIF